MNDAPNPKPFRVTLDDFHAIPTVYDDEKLSEERAHTWKPIDLAEAEHLPPEPPEIAEIVYPGRIHVWSGEPETLKSMVAMAVCLQEIRRGQFVAYIDLENGIREVVARMRSLGATDAELSRFLYYSPEESLVSDIRTLQEVQETFARCRPSVCVIDSYTGSLAIHGCDPNSAIDVERHNVTVVKPLAVHGAAMVILDHLPKQKEGRGKFSIGSERKVGVADIHLGFEVLVALSRGHYGIVKLIVHKDRPGYLHRPKAAQIRLDSLPDGAITWTIEPAEDTPIEQREEVFRPTVLMERVSRWLEMQTVQVSMNDVEKNVPGNARYRRQAVEMLIAEGFVAQHLGARNSRLLESISVYRTDNDSGPTSSMTSSMFDPASTDDLVHPLRPSENGMDTGVATSSTTSSTTSSIERGSTSSIEASPPTRGDAPDGRGEWGYETEPEREHPDPIYFTLEDTE